MVDLINRVRDRLRGRDPIDIILDSPMGAKLIADETKKDDAERRRLGAIIEAAEKERDEKLAVLNKQFADAHAAWEDAKAEAARKDKALQAVYGERWNFKHRIEHTINQAGLALRAIAPPEIAAAKAELIAREERVRKAGPQDEKEFLYHDLSGNAVFKILATNRHTLSAWLQAASEAREALDRLEERYVADYAAECQRILDQLGDGPAVEKVRDGPLIQT